MSFFGLLSSIVRKPYIWLNETSSGSSPGCSFIKEAISVLLAYYSLALALKSETVEDRVESATSLRPAKAGFIIRALRGIADIGRREQQPRGVATRRIGMRSDINGNKNAPYDGYIEASKRCPEPRVGDASMRRSKPIVTRILNDASQFWY